MQVSTTGRAFLRAHEGEVLKSYRCPAGVWTVGVGLTKGSGVVDPKPGMTITREESDRLLSLALARNYEPRVSKAMPNAKQHEFDGGASFDFNTGRIHNAGWVNLWRAKAAADKIRAGLMQWTKGGGKVLPGLKRRRQEEADVILLDKWPADLNLGVAVKPVDHFARFVISVTDEEIAVIRDGFRKVGFEPGPMKGRVLRLAVEDFQRKYDLTPDGLIGRATLSTLQRELDARAKATNTVAAGGGGAAVSGGNEAASDPSAVDPSILGDPLVTWIGVAILAAAALYGLWLAWRYRDVVASRIATTAPRLAAWLRSR